MTMQTGGRHAGGSAAGEAMALDALEDCPTREIVIVTVESNVVCCRHCELCCVL